MIDSDFVLSSFADGEPVDPAALEDALRRRGAVEFLVDLARLRQRLRTSATYPASASTRTGSAGRTRMH